MMLITGAAGMVGSYLCEVFAADSMVRTDRRPEAGIQYLDVTDARAVTDTIKRLRPATVIHLAAETDVDKCERDPTHAYATNAIGAGNVAVACASYDAEMVYISTAGVFDGQAGPYTEQDVPAPLSIYAKAKYEGEGLVARACPRSYVLRAGWMFGGGARDKKFVGKIAEQCLAGASEVYAVTDKFGSPTFARDLLHPMKVLLAARAYGLYHIVNTGWCSRYELALEIVSALGRTMRVVPVGSDRFPLAAPRPRSEAALTNALLAAGVPALPAWQESLARYLASFRSLSFGEPVPSPGSRQSVP